MTDNSLGRELPRAKPVVLTFYDTLKDVPFTTTFYVREEETESRVEEFIEAICAVTPCILGKYKIGYQEYLVPDYRDHLEGLSAYAVGGQKWVIKYRTEQGRARSFSIPGRDPELSINAQRGSPIGKKGKAPELSLPEWQQIVSLVKALCVDKTGEEIMDWVDLDYRNEKWPPKSARR